MKRPPRRPPDRKLLFAALMLLAMASAFATRAEPDLFHKDVVSLKGL
ncbi:MAG TPA: hypothetical protein VNH80_04140 [Burkholderiales bacterium]|nr:hypothetical protein [Burkholderiales bacterium]HXJ07916.1 hypothetical protein [Burkholderiales bacterium]